jgi:signal transduction histidine kinase
VTHLDPGGLANELHDGVVQELSALLLQLETYQRKLESDPDGARMDLDRIKTQARQTLKSLREVISRLREMESGR